MKLSKTTIEKVYATFSQITRLSTHEYQSDYCPTMELTCFTNLTIQDPGNQYHASQVKKGAVALSSPPMNQLARLKFSSVHRMRISVITLARMGRGYSTLFVLRWF